VCVGLKDVAKTGTGAREDEAVSARVDPEQHIYIHSSYSSASISNR